MATWELTIAERPVATKGSTSVVMSVPVTRALEGRRISSVRPSLWLESGSGDVEARLVFQTSNDGVTWAASSTLTGYTSYLFAAGWTYGTTFAAVTAAPFHRFVVEARNRTATKKDCVRMRLLLELMSS